MCKWRWRRSWRVRQLVEEEGMKMEVEEGKEQPRGGTATVAEPSAAVSPSRKREREV